MIAILDWYADHPGLGLGTLVVCGIILVSVVEAWRRK